MTDAGKRKLKNVRDCSNTYSAGTHIYKGHNAT